jgi:hypothetical protein
VTGSPDQPIAGAKRRTRAPGGSVTEAVKAPLLVVRRAPPTVRQAFPAARWSR